VQAEEYPLSSALESVTNPEVSVNDSEQIAAALNTLEGGMYRRIRPADYINHLQEHQFPDRVAEARTTTLKITFWVEQKVLHCNDIQERGKMFKFFLKIAEVRFCDCLEA
jgi:hypothetical protein